MRKLLFPLLLFGLAGTTNAQTDPTLDTIALARAKAYEKDFAAADTLLTHYTVSHPDINALRLHAQVLYWDKQFSRSEEMFEKALVLFPEEVVVKLEYGRTLFEQNKLKKAQALLSDYLTHDSLNAEAAILLSYIDLWKGRLVAARQRAARTLKRYPGNKESLDVLQQISYQTTPVIHGGVAFGADDQPLTGSAYQLEASQYRSHFFFPSLQLQLHNFSARDTSASSLFWQVGNKFILGRTTLSLAGGVFQSGEKKAVFAGTAGLTQKLSATLWWDATLEKRPYQYTLASVRQTVAPTVYTTALRLDRGERWLGKAAYELQQFADANRIQTVYAWLLAPLVHHKALSIKGGYAFSYAHADYNTYQAAEPLGAVRASTPLYSQVAGVYIPYFTPNHQVVHALLASLQASLSNKVAFSTRASIGIAASADNPYLYLDQKSNRDYFIHEVYSSQHYTPVEWVSELKISVSPRLSLSGGYTLNNLLFYRRHEGSLQFKYLFIHEHKS